MAKELTVVVTGSTGKHGGAVARGLLEPGHKVRAVTRDPNSNQARLLANAGAAPVAASLEDPAAIMKALECPMRTSFPLARIWSIDAYAKERKVLSADHRGGITRSRDRSLVQEAGVRGSVSGRT
jgi:nucleoside-diphosphate-sugar epimerase